MSAGPTEMELRVARALKGSDAFDPSHDLSDYVTMARAAIRAMREPTRDMETHGLATMDQFEIDAAVLRGRYGLDALEPDYIWRAMIDAASPEHRSAEPLTSFPLDEGCPE